MKDVKRSAMMLASLCMLVGVSFNACAIFIDLNSPQTALNGNLIASMQVGGQNVVTESGPSELDFTLALQNGSTITLDILVEATEGRPYIAFSTNLINLAAAPLSVFSLALSGPVTFAQTLNMSATGQVVLDAAQQFAEITLDVPVTTGSSLALGLPNHEASFDDWLLNLNGLSAGDRFLLTIGGPVSTNLQSASVPEPPLTMLLISALMALLWRRQTRPRKLILSVISHR